MKRGKKKKFTILGGVKVSSAQLAEWGQSGGRPRKYASAAKRAQAYRLRKKRAKLGQNVQLRTYVKKGKKLIKN